MKYKAPDSQEEILPNLLGLSTLEEIGLAEFEGFLSAEIILTEQLNPTTRFDIHYLKNIHTLALKHLYSFAGNYHSVNISKGGFLFASARFLAETMETFNNELLLNLPNNYSSRDQLMEDIAKVHGELLFIHPFREGNGRTARVLANLMARKQGYSSLKFETVGKKEFDVYVSAVQKSAGKDYSQMIAFIHSVFPD